MSTMPPISRSRSARLICVTSPAASICASQARRSCFGALDAAVAARGSTLVFMAMVQSLRSAHYSRRLAAALTDRETARGKLAAAVPDLGAPGAFDDLFFGTGLEGLLGLLA